MKQIITKTTISIELEVEVVGYYTAEVKGDYTSEFFPAELEVQKVEFEGMDITPILKKANYDFGLIEYEYLEKAKNGQV
jgi:hypothetical protein